MNALPIWDAELRTSAAPVLDPTADSLAAADTLAAADAAELAPATPALPGGARGAALAGALETLDPTAGLAGMIEHLLAAVDAADDAAGIARVDTHDEVLRQRIARLVAGTNLPSRGPGTRARDILTLLRTHRPT